MGNFHVKTQNSTDFAHTFSKNYIFLYSLMKIILFTLKIYLFGSKIAFKKFFTTKDAKCFVKIIFSNIFTFLSVIRQNFEYNLRILANFVKFSCKNSKIYGFPPYVFKKLGFFLYFLIIHSIILFTLKIYSFGPKIAFKAFCTRKDTKSFAKINFLVTFLHF